MTADATAFPRSRRLARLALGPWRDGRARQALFSYYHLETRLGRPVIVIRSESGLSFLMVFWAVLVSAITVPLGLLPLVVSLGTLAGTGGGWWAVGKSLEMLGASSLFGVGLFAASRWMRDRFEVIDEGDRLVFVRRGLLGASQAFSKSDLREVNVRHEIELISDTESWSTSHTCDLEIIVHARAAFPIARWLGRRGLKPTMARRLALDLCRLIARTGRQIVVDRRPPERRCQHREVASYDLYESRFDGPAPRREQVSARELDRFFTPGDLAIPEPRIREPIVIIPAIHTAPYPLVSDTKARKMGEDADAPEGVRPRLGARLAWRLRRELTFGWVRDLPEWAQPMAWGLAASVPIMFLMFMVRSFLTGR
jgi:hypothetical protein